VLAGRAAHAEEGVGALEHLHRVGLDDGAFLADRVAFLDDVVAGVEPREGEVAVAAALELPRVDVDRLALTHGIFFCNSSKDSHDKSGLDSQDHQESAALHGDVLAFQSLELFPLLGTSRWLYALCLWLWPKPRRASVYIGVQI
jgi:hypothetical protein